MAARSPWPITQHKAAAPPRNFHCPSHIAWCEAAAAAHLSNAGKPTASPGIFKCMLQSCSHLGKLQPTQSSLSCKQTCTLRPLPLALHPPQQTFTTFFTTCCWWGMPALALHEVAAGHVRPSSPGLKSKPLCKTLGRKPYKVNSCCMKGWTGRVWSTIGTRRWRSTTRASGVVECRGPKGHRWWEIGRWEELKLPRSQCGQSVKYLNFELVTRVCMLQVP